MNADVRVVPAELEDPKHAAALVTLLDLYAQGETGGGAPLLPSVRGRLVDELRMRPSFRGFLAFESEEAVGLATTFEGFSTFAARPLLNVHDLVVHPAWRGRGVARALLAAVTTTAQGLGCCKVTLEVLEGNARARAVYERAGFHSYQLDPSLGRALFLEKKLI